MQMDCDIERGVQGLSQNHGYLAAVVGDTSVQVFVIAERCLLGNPNNAVNALTALIGVYFSFNMAYPKPIYPTIIFVQQFVLNIVDSQSVPDVVKRVLGSLDRIDVQ